MRRTRRKNVMLPAFARPKHVKVEERTQRLTQWAETAEINRMEINDPSIGIITSGNSYQYAKEAMGGGASYLKLGMVNPLPVELIKTFAEKVEKVYVIEELDDVIESHCKRSAWTSLARSCSPCAASLTRAWCAGCSPARNCPPKPWRLKFRCGLR